MKRALLLVLALSGCTPLAGVWLRIEAPFEVPAQVDRVRVEVQRVSDGTTVHDSTRTLPGPFPHTLSLTTDDPRTVGEVTVKVTALKGTVPVSEESGRVVLERDALVDLNVRLCDCPR